MQTVVYVLLVWQLVAGQPVAMPGKPVAYPSAALCEHYRAKVASAERLAVCLPHSADLCGAKLRCPY